jgi:hypothetical protein
MKMAEKPSKPSTTTTVDTVPLPVYEKQLENIRFIFQSSIDRGGILRASQIVNKQYKTTNTKDLLISNTGAKFIQVTVGAQNKGTVNIAQNAWDLGNIIDSENREFVALNTTNVNPWLPNPNLCGALLKPAFDPTSCTKIYEVAKESTGLKIEVLTGVNNTPNNLSSKKTISFPLDIIVK